jgi:hypothetical protein
MCSQYKCGGAKFLNQAVRCGPAGRRDIMSGEIKAMDVLKLEQALGVFMKLRRTRRNESER